MPKPTDLTLENFVVSPEEANSRLWRRFMLHLAGQRELLREKNDSVSLPIADTTALRGEIRMVKRMLALAVEAGPSSRLVDGEEHPDADEQFFPPHGGR